MPQAIYVADSSTSIAFLCGLRGLPIFGCVLANAIVFLKIIIPNINNIVLVISLILLNAVKVFVQMLGDIRLKFEVDI